jgi:type II secretory pathway component PulF
VSGVLWSLAAGFSAAPIFAKMFAEFGQDLPAFTALSLKPWFQILLALIPLVIVADGILRRATRRGRAVRMCLAIFLSLALPGVFLVGMYLPIFTISGAVK